MKINENVKLGLLVVTVASAIAVQCFHPTTVTERTKVFYDCRIAEISPDIPPKVKEECRKKMSNSAR
jgi:hypothetical protein